ncbi:MAG: hypothetical protein IT517_01040 [Burkholderiales bacterium]|nr:hypothetical protein [Burkholderiales bacterium]
MIEAGSVEFMYARVSARYGAHPDEALWRRIELTRDFATVLAAMRASPLAGWVVGVGADADVHAVEAAARRRWRQLVAEVGGFMPAAWQPAVLWCALLADLPVLLHVAHGGDRAPWLAADPVYGEVARRALKDVDAGRSQLVAAAAHGAHRLVGAWRAEWLRRLPRPLARTGALAHLVAVVDAHARAFAAAHPADGWPLRRALHARVALLFRRAALEPAAAFVYLALAALEYERVRGELMRRCVFPAQPLAT